MTESTFVIIKPDGMQRGLSEKIISRIVEAGLTVAAQKDVYVTHEQAERLYAEHKGKAFYNGLIQYLMSGLVKVMRVEGENAVAVMRALMGKTIPEDAEPGTIRADFRFDYPRGGVVMNTVHGSDSAASAKREQSIFFN